jgi:hypothetical protein
MFRCNSCGYESSRKFNISKHIKNVHKRDVSDEEMMCNQEGTQITTGDNEITTGDNEITTNFNEITTDFNEITTDFNEITTENCTKKIMFTCKKCNKELSSFQNLTKHEQGCKGVSNILECHYCHQIFASQQCKSKHIQRCKIKKTQDHANAIVEQRTTEHNHINQITNNSNNSNKQIIYQFNTNNYRISNSEYKYKHKHKIDKENVENMNDFGNEDISYITDEQLHDISLNNKLKLLILMKHFHPEHPENHNIRINGNKSYKVLVNKKWSLEPKETVHSTIYYNGKAQINNYAYEHILPTLNEHETDEYLDRIIQYDKHNKKNVLKTIELKAEELFDNMTQDVGLLENKEIESKSYLSTRSETAGGTVIENEVKDEKIAKA